MLFRSVSQSRYCNPLFPLLILSPQVTILFSQDLDIFSLNPSGFFPNPSGLGFLNSFVVANTSVVTTFAVKANLAAFV